MAAHRRDVATRPLVNVVVTAAFLVAGVRPTVAAAQETTVTRTPVEVTSVRTLDVFVDNQSVGATPLLLSLLPGTYTIRGERPGVVSTSSVVIVRANEPRRIILPAEDTSPNLTWVWVGVGGALVAGLALGVALAATQSR